MTKAQTVFFAASLLAFAPGSSYAQESSPKAPASTPAKPASQPSATPTPPAQTTTSAQATVETTTAKPKDSKKVKLEWGGYIKADYIFDSRQPVGARRGNFYLYPAPPGEQNGDPNFNGYAIETRLLAKISGFEFFGMKSSGVVEGDFFGVNNDNINGFHLRNAYVKLSNDKIDILAGQFWHPMFVLNVTPSTYSFNAGTPYQPFNRSPQLRIETKGKNVRFIGAVLTELDFRTVGASASRSGIPTVHAQVQFGNDAKFVGGVGGNVKTVRIEGTKKNLTSLAYLGYLKATFSKVTWKAEAVYGGNMTELLQEGGFAMDANGKHIANQTISAWTEFSGDFSKSMEWGLFGGYSVNNSFGKPVTNITGKHKVFNTYRISPRIGWKSGKVRIGIEGDYSATQYGVINGATGNFVVSDDGKVNNIRGLASIRYTF